ncbi:ANTAR domain-containing protein [Rhodococcoides kyotonense]|uniref:ANTAR domain-containing protein n=1 Tax=Rhodococcoides kyotonense TaxID=398843 RepID=A0A239J6Y6_9NOCA|nr:ANTAR domain-containing protein [Rhodococcus kyotonensis]SNT01786.1 ANTAR domain-containing protein [Rhodococcus kyotonensis]
MDDSRTNIDLAVGVLIALRGCSPEQAFEELVAHSHEFNVSLLQSSRSLVAEARKQCGANDAVWGEVLADRKPSGGIENVA